MAIIGKARDPQPARRALEEWLSAKTQGSAEIRGWELPKMGFSNETVCFEVRTSGAGGRAWEPVVLRVQPEGHSLFLNADVSLQWRMMMALEKTAVPVPRVRWIEPGRKVLGSPFFLMDRVEGRVPPDIPNLHVGGWIKDLEPESRRTVFHNALTSLSELHKLDWRDGFQFLAQGDRGEPGLDRYLYWVEDWYAWASAGRSFPIIEAGIDYLRRKQPTGLPTSVLWGDARLPNMIIGSDLRVAAVLDWEMAALGPAEVDLGWWLMSERRWTEEVGVDPIAGVPDRMETIALYEGLLGRPLSDMDYFLILGAVRLAIIMVRAIDSQVAQGILSPTTTAGTNNTVSRMLGRMLGLPPVPLSEDQAGIIQRAAAGASAAG